MYPAIFSSEALVTLSGYWCDLVELNRNLCPYASPRLVQAQKRSLSNNTCELCTKAVSKLLYDKFKQLTKLSLHLPVTTLKDSAFVMHSNGKSIPQVPCTPLVCQNSSVLFNC